MRKQKFPAAKLVPWLPAIGRLILDLFLETGRWPEFLSWQNLMWWGLLVFIGVVYSDYINKNSDIRAWWRYKMRLFDVVINTPHIVEDGEEFLGVAAKITAVADLSDSEAFLHVHGLQKNIESLTLRLPDWAGLSRGESVTIQIIKIPLRPGTTPSYPYWLDSKHILTGGSEIVGELEIRTKTADHKHRFFLKKMDLSSGTMGRLFVADENHQALEIPNNGPW